MTAHELAKRLLAMQDVPVVISDEGDYNPIRDLELTAGFDQKQVIRLLRIGNPK